MLCVASSGVSQVHKFKVSVGVVFLLNYHEAKGREGHRDASRIMIVGLRSSTWVNDKIIIFAEHMAHEIELRAWTGM